MFKHILVATDGTPLADKALATALALARSCGAKMTALLVVPDYTSHDYIEDVIGRGLRSETLRATLAEAGKQRLALALAAHGDESVAAGRLVAVSDEPYDEILAHAERERCDVIVMASRGRGALKSALLGSQTVQVIAGSTIPVLVVK